MLTKAMSLLAYTNEGLHQVYELSCGEDDISLHWRLQMEGYCWLESPKMLPDFGRLLAMLGTSQCGRVVICSRSTRLEETILKLVMHSVALESNWCHERKKTKVLIEEDQLRRRCFNQGSSKVSCKL